MDKMFLSHGDKNVYVCRQDQSVFHVSINGHEIFSCLDGLENSIGLLWTDAIDFYLPRFFNGPTGKSFFFFFFFTSVMTRIGKTSFFSFIINIIQYIYSTFFFSYPKTSLEFFDKYVKIYTCNSKWIIHMEKGHVFFFFLSIKRERQAKKIEIVCTD